MRKTQLTRDLCLGDHALAESFGPVELPELRTASRLIGAVTPCRGGRGDTQQPKSPGEGTHPVGGALKSQQEEPAAAEGGERFSSGLSRLPPARFSGEGGDGAVRATRSLSSTFPPAPLLPSPASNKQHPPPRGGQRTIQSLANGNGGWKRARWPGKQRQGQSLARGEDAAKGRSSVFQEAAKGEQSKGGPGEGNPRAGCRDRARDVGCSLAAKNRSYAWAVKSVPRSTQSNPWQHHSKKARLHLSERARRRRRRGVAEDAKENGERLQVSACKV